MNTTGIWETSGKLNPYVNDTSKRVTFIYMEAASGERLFFGNIIASLRDFENNTVEGKERLLWYDLYITRGGDEDYKGLYQVVIDTTSIHAGDYILYISIQKEGYAAQAVDILVHVEPVPAAIIVTDPYVQLFEGEKFTLTVFYYDVFHGKNIVNGNLTYNVDGYKGFLEHKGYGLYQASFDTASMSLNDGNHTIIVNAQGVDYQNSQYNITLNYNIRLDVKLTVSNLPETVIVGEEIIIRATLKYLNNEPA